jgi:hypothetical protein
MMFSTRFKNLEGHGEKKNYPISSATTIGKTDTMAWRRRGKIREKNNGMDSFHRQRLQFIPN